MLQDYLRAYLQLSHANDFINHTIQLALDLMVYSNIWAVLWILLKTQDVNTSYMQTMHDYYNSCYDTRTQEYMVLIEKASE